jgi:isopentenyl-diphosphate delta-isomerase
MLLQKRAESKYHSGGLWTNACCSHPRPGEEIIEAAMRRMKEELGFQIPIKKIFEFTYRTEFQNGLTENEFDHVFTGEYDGLISANKNEISDYCYKNMEDIKDSLQSHPHKYTVWFLLAFPQIEKWWQLSYPSLSVHNNSI